MHKVITLVIVTLVCFQLNGQEIKWYSWNQGYPLAVESGKIIFVDIIKNNCVFCKKMDVETFRDPEIVNLIDKDYIAIKLNADYKDSTYMVDGKTYTTTQLLCLLTNNSKLDTEPRLVFPTYAFMFPEDKTLFVETGFQEAKIFRFILLNCVKIHLKSKK